MSTNRFLATVLILLSPAACNPFNRGEAVRVSTQDTELNTTWHASLVSPASLADGSVTVSQRTPASGDYYVAVYASDANRMVVAWGNLAPPAE